jgi:hypothetical protein
VEVSHKENKTDTQKEKYTARVLQRLQKWKKGKCIQVEREYRKKQFLRHVKEIS